MSVTSGGTVPNGLRAGGSASGPAGSAGIVITLSARQAGGLTGRAGLPPEIGVRVRYERLAVTHAIGLGRLPTLSIGFIDKNRLSPLSRAPLLRRFLRFLSHLCPSRRPPLSYQPARPAN